MEVNLNTAHKYLTKLKAHQNSQKKSQQSNRNNRYNRYGEPEPDKFNGVLSCESVLLYGGSNDEIKSKILEKVQDYKDTYQEKRAVSLDIIKIQQAIHKANVETGIDEALGLVGWFNAEITDMKECLKELDGSNKSQIDNLEKFIEKFIKYSEKEKEIGTTPNVTIETSIHAYTKEELNNSVKQNQKKIAELEDKIMGINATTKVKLELGPKSLEILGLE
jgi:hypothetical protein